MVNRMLMFQSTIIYPSLLRSFLKCRCQAEIVFYFDVWSLQVFHFIFHRVTLFFHCRFFLFHFRGKDDVLHYLIIQVNIVETLKYLLCIAFYIHVHV